MVGRAHVIVNAVLLFLCCNGSAVHDQFPVAAATSFTVSSSLASTSASSPLAAYQYSLKPFKPYSRYSRLQSRRSRSKEVNTPSLFANHLRRSPRRASRLAAIMTPGDGTLTETPTSTSFPNWRVVPQSTKGVICSPFCHPLANGENENQGTSEPTACSAEWSKAAYLSALDLHDKLKECKDPYLSPMIESALHDLESAYRLYGPHCMVGSYNGGKDACVIFHLMRAAHANYCREMQRSGEGFEEDNKFMIPRPRVIYFQHADEFPEVLDLLHETVDGYDVEMLAFKEGVSFGEGLTHLVESNFSPGKDGVSYYTSDMASTLPPPHPLAFILGTRKNDPNAGSQGVYAPSSHYMPPFLRVNPVLNWQYDHVWQFLRQFDLPYCSLYDEGFTSLGTVKDTLPCPALKKEDGGYLPAHMLKDWSLERAGRIKKEKKGVKTETDSKPAAKEVAKKDATRRLADVTMSQTSSTVSLSTLDLTNHSTNNSAIIGASMLYSRSASYCPPTVGLIVIGDELLKGKTPDSNIIAAARALRSYNVKLSRVSIISDDAEEIVNEINRVSNEVDFLVTSGGVGPTHDDVTIKSVAEALGLDMEIHNEMAELLLKKMGNGTQEGDELPEGIRKMATLPSSSILKYLAGKDEWPILQCKNIFILPGVPVFFDKKIQLIAEHLYSSNDVTSGSGKEDSAQLERTSSTTTSPPRSSTYRIILSLEENSIVEALNAAVANNPQVLFGSYPLVEHPVYKTIITLEGKFYNEGDEWMEENVKSALEDLKSMLPEEYILHVDNSDDLNPP